MITKIEDIQELVKSGFTDWKTLGEVNTHVKDELTIFNYSDMAEYKGEWNFFERISRGLILNNKTGEIVARPFDKFFNWGANGKMTTASIKCVTEKMDGSLGILYRQNGQYKISTRGSFESEQAKWASEFINNNKLIRYDCFPDNWTLLFEIIYPENKIVVDYKGEKNLYLLAIRDRFTGQYLSRQYVTMTANHYGFALPKVYYFQKPEDVIALTEKIDKDQEGWVVEFVDGERFKFKGKRYLELHKFISTLSYKRVLESMENDTLESFILVTPQEYLNIVNTWVKDIRSIIANTKLKVKEAYDQMPQGTRKECAIWIMANHKDLSAYLFHTLDNKPIDSVIYKQAFKTVPNLKVKDMTEEL